MYTGLKNAIVKLPLRSSLLVLSIAFTLTACDSGSSGSSSNDQVAIAQKPNILFVIMDDVGIDQMTSFGYGGAVEIPMPNMNAVADAGLKFRNTWAQPECSPARAAFFTGRYPTRTNIYQALGENDLAVAQLSPYELTTPKLLKKAGYESAMFGKFHLAGPENNPDEYKTPHVLGWDYFYGWLDGMPPPIDTTAGGVNNDVVNTPYTCGYVPHDVSNTGACYFSPESGKSAVAAPMDAASPDPAGLQCLTAGGIFVPNANPSDPAPIGLDFNKPNTYYVSPLLVLDHGEILHHPVDNPPVRGYRSTLETDEAIRWINSRPANKPWMATVSYTSAHTPWQTAPSSLLSNPGIVQQGKDCVSVPFGRLIQDDMTEAMDTEFGRLLVETGLATMDDNNKLQYNPRASNTIIVIIGDNGTLAMAVKQPFSEDRAKGTSYQTGVWVPLIISGPGVAEPGAELNQMVNGVDLFEFFAEIAGLDAHQEAPRVIDSVGMMDYIKNPNHAEKRTISFAVAGLNQQVGDIRNSPCVVDPGLQSDGSTTTVNFSDKTCMQVATNEHICNDNMGVWWGENLQPGQIKDLPVGYQPRDRYNTCAQVNEDLAKANNLNDPADLYKVLPRLSIAMRNADYKLVRSTIENYTFTNDPFVGETVDIETEEFYPVNQAGPLLLKLDDASENLFNDSGDFVNPPSPAQSNAYKELEVKLDALMVADLDCPGDGNIDSQVDGTDISNWSKLSQEWKGSSVYDFAGITIDGKVYPDGKTDDADYFVIVQNQAQPCSPTYGVY